MIMFALPFRDTVRRFPIRFVHESHVVTDVIVPRQRSVISTKNVTAMIICCCSMLGCLHQTTNNNGNDNDANAAKKHCSRNNESIFFFFFVF